MDISLFPDIECTKLRLLTVVITGGLVHEHPGVDDVSEAAEHVLQVGLTQRPREPADVKVSVFNRV